MSGNGAASGDDESGFATLGDADGFLTVLSRKDWKNKRKGKTTPDGVITVLFPIQLTIQNVAVGRGVTCSEGFVSQG